MTARRFFQPSSRDRSTAMFTAGLVMLAAAVILLLASLYVVHWPKQAHETQTAYGNGQLVAMGSVSMKINGVSFSDGKPMFPARPDHHYVIVDLSVTNLSDKPVNILPASDIYLKQLSGEVAYLTPFELDEPFHAGELSPGETVRGQISYMAPKSAQYKLYVDGIWSGGVVPFSLR